jgi:arylsulfatase A-like enzyme
VPAGKPFCFWFGSHDPHRPYDRGFGGRSGLKPDLVSVPPYLPDTPDVRSDILDYYISLQRFDRELGQIFKILEAAGQLENTLIVVTGDNGWPFPRAKGNLYDAGTLEPLAVRWPARSKGGRTLESFVSLTDLGPTFLEAAGLKVPPEMTGRSLLGLLTGDEKSGQREMVFLEREREANSRKGDLGYPARAVRTREFLYLRNLRPERWPAGDPEAWKAAGPFGDCENSPTKETILARRGEPAMTKLFNLSFAKRPAEELYDLSKDPQQVVNVAEDAAYGETLKKLRAELDRWMSETKDPRSGGAGDELDRHPWIGDAKKMRGHVTDQPAAEENPNE